jgi:mono/diheme cytochrome c family protein
MTAGMCIARAAMAVALLGGIGVSRIHAAQQSNPPSPPVSPPTATGRPAPAAPAGNADAGQQAYVKNGCYACHGREGQGSPTTGPRLGPNPVPLATFTGYVRAPRGQMPPYPEKTVSDAALADMLAFLQSRPRPASSIDSLVPK